MSLLPKAIVEFEIRMVLLLGTVLNVANGGC